MGTDVKLITSKTYPRQEFQMDRAYHLFNLDTQNVPGIDELRNPGLPALETRNVLSRAITANNKGEGERFNYWLQHAMIWITVSLNPGDMVQAVIENDTGYLPEFD